jgi:hypothetical protein
LGVPSNSSHGFEHLERINHVQILVHHTNKISPIKPGIKYGMVQVPTTVRFLLCYVKRNLPRILRLGTAADRLMAVLFRTLPGAWMSVSYECVVLPRTSLCDGPVTGPAEPYRLWCVTVRDLETSRNRRPWPPLGCCVKGKKLKTR